MGAAQHHRLDGLVQIGREQFRQKRVDTLAFQLAILHAFHETGTGHRHRMVAIAFHQRLKLGQLQRNPGSQHQYLTLPRQQRSGLQRRFDADHRQRQLLPQLGSCHAGGGVAGDDNGLAAVGHQLVHALTGELQHLCGILVAIGNVGSIAKIDIILPG